MFQTSGNDRDTETVMPGGKFLSFRHIDGQGKHDAEKGCHKQRSAVTEDASSHEISLCPHWRSLSRSLAAFFVFKRMISIKRYPLTLREQGTKFSARH
jgi:hypothetical protein